MSQSKNKIIIDTKVTMTVKKSTIGYVGIVKEYPVVVEASSKSALDQSVAKCLLSYFNTFPQEVSKKLNIKVNA